MKQPSQTRLVLIRHGRTALNAEGRYRGRIDVPLDPVGEMQVEALGAHLAALLERPIGSLVSSPLRRAVATAEAVASYFNVGVGLDERLIDLDFGNWAGKTPGEAALESPAVHATWIERPDETPLPGGDRLDVHADQALQLALALAADLPGQTVALVSHDAICQALTCRLLKIPLRRFRLVRHSPAAFSVFELTDRGWEVAQLNESCHLAKWQ